MGERASAGLTRMLQTSGLVIAGGLIICLLSVSEDLLLKFSGLSGALFTRDRGSESALWSVPGVAEAGGLTLSCVTGETALGEAELTGTGLLTKERGSEECLVGESLSWCWK